MRYSLLDQLACPYCYVDLACYTHREFSAPVETGRFPGGTRVPFGTGLGPAPATVEGELAALLTKHASPAADPERGFSVGVEEGLLICGGCGRWYPIVGQLPELLPDHLRDQTRDVECFGTFAAGLPAEVRAACERFVPGGVAGDDEGAHHKRSEIAVKSKVHDADFFTPGFTSPFNPANTEFTIRLIHLFGAVAPLLDTRQGDVVIDSGSGYSWTTEWLFKAGVNAIGVDICRTYVEIGMARIGASRPHLVIADVEQLPFRSGCAQGVLAYESFHHVPNRPRAIRGYARVLAEGGRVVLAEPDGAHEHAAGSVEAMRTFGILEKGMDLSDVARYAAGSGFAEPEQIFLSYAAHYDLPRRVVEIARRGSPIDGNIFVLRRGQVLNVVKTHDAGGQTPEREKVLDSRPDPYDARYYAQYWPAPYVRSEQWLNTFRAIADRIVGDIGPKRVLDAGCALGLLVEALRSRGVEAFGFDVSAYAISQVHESARSHCRIGSVTQELDGRYDLIVCLEVLEHVPQAEAEAAIANFCRHTDDVLFSSTSGHYDEATHINVRMPEEWAELFARHGFLRDLDFDATFIAPWAVRFRRRTEPVPRLVRAYERAFARTAIERNELRAQVLHFDRDIIVAAAETPRLRDELAAINRLLLDTQHKLNQANDRVVHMERSAFWRLRNLWMSVRALLGGGRGDG
jgi:2-polyprenyl-3-methyl-5-hydroxy-6-metoxy-1,4-benzoquinol methylase/uncharacterized protein YbaR (Trm112 family)